jgi:hypothetical protein
MTNSDKVAKVLVVDDEFGEYDICSLCRAEISDTDTHCTNCGALIEKEVRHDA